MENRTWSKFGIVVRIRFITCLLGMVIPIVSPMVFFEPVFITLLVATGVNSVPAAMLSYIYGVICGITPSLNLGMYASMSLVGSDFEAAFKNNL